MLIMEAVKILVDFITGFPGSAIAAPSIDCMASGR